MTLRPYGLIIKGELHLGLEIVREEGRIVQIRPHTGIPEAFVISVPFVNAHSHLEYRSFQGQLSGLRYWEWIRELTRRKAGQSFNEVKMAALLAADENHRTGVGLIGEHSDRPVSGEAMAKTDLNGIIFQEVITFFERESPAEKLDTVRKNADANRRAFKGQVELSPHTLYTVDPATLVEFGKGTEPISLHLAESRDEREFLESGKGAIADFYRSNGVPFEPTGLSPVGAAIQLGLMRAGSQMVHACDVKESEVEVMAGSGASVVHCPRSNENLGCPKAPVREYLAAGLDVGLGMDSAASSGPIDMFAEMRSAVEVARDRGRPLFGDEVWNMATTMGARTMGTPDWDIAEGYWGHLLAIHVEGAQSTEELVERGRPEAIEWIA